MDRMSFASRLMVSSMSVNKSGLLGTFLTMTSPEVAQGKNQEQKFNKTHHEGELNVLINRPGRRG